MTDVIRAVVLVLLFAGATQLHGQFAWPLGPGEVEGEQKIGDGIGGFDGLLVNFDRFGTEVASIGDVNGDGVQDIVATANGDDDGIGEDLGAAWILFMNPDGTVASESKISATSGFFFGELEDLDRFGTGLAAPGDLDGDGVPDLIVGADREDDGGINRGAIWTLFLNADGTVKGHQKVSATSGGFTGQLLDDDHFGESIAVIGDLDQNGVVDLIVGADGDDDGGASTGAVWILFMAPGGLVQGHQKISATSGGFTGLIEAGGAFGSSVGALGDLDGDGVPDVAVSYPLDGDSGFSAGAVWILFLNVDGTVKSHSKISGTAGGFVGPLEPGDVFGASPTLLSDLDGNGVRDLAVGASGDSDAGAGAGTIWILFLDSSGTVIAEQQITGGIGSMVGPIGAQDKFGGGVAVHADLNGDGDLSIIVGSQGAKEVGNGYRPGGLWVIEVASQWSTLGPGLAGTAGVPLLEARGSMQAGELVTLAMTNARPFSSTTLVIGLSNLSVPFKQGVLVPTPDFLIPSLSDGFGEWILNVIWPPGVPPGVTSYYQFWVVDPAGPVGLAASNGVQKTSP